MMDMPNLAINHMTITGVDRATAQSLTPALEAALANLSPLPPGNIPHLRLHLPPEATATDIAAALATALARQR